MRMVRDILMNLTTFDPDNEDNSSGDVSGSGDGEESFSTSVTRLVSTTDNEEQLADENSDVFPTVIVAVATSIAVVVVIAFLVIALIFWRKARSKAKARKLSQQQDHRSPSTAISYNHTNEIISFSSPGLAPITHAKPDVVPHPQPRPRTKINYLEAKKSPDQELDHDGRLSCRSNVYDEVKDSETSNKII